MRLEPVPELLATNAIEKAWMARSRFRRSRSAKAPRALPIVHRAIGRWCSRRRWPSCAGSLRACRCASSPPLRLWFAPSMTMQAKDTACPCLNAIPIHSKATRAPPPPMPSCDIASARLEDPGRKDWSQHTAKLEAETEMKLRENARLTPVRREETARRVVSGGRNGPGRRRVWPHAPESWEPAPGWEGMSGNWCRRRMRPRSEMAWGHHARRLEDFPQRKLLAR